MKKSKNMNRITSIIQELDGIQAVMNECICTSNYKGNTERLVRDATFLKTAIYCLSGIDSRISNQVSWADGQLVDTDEGKRS